MILHMWVVLAVHMYNNNGIDMCVRESLRALCARAMYTYTCLIRMRFCCGLCLLPFTLL